MQTTLVRTGNGRMPYFAALDGVRAYCVLLVMFDHLKSDGHTIAWLDGHLGVDLFFILSGFLITTLLRREEVITGKIDFGAFYWRRFFRIVPVYGAVFLVYVVVLQTRAQAQRWIQFRAAIPWFLTLMNEFARESNHGSVFLHTWSLGVEEKFYLVWPVVCFVLARTARLRWTALAGLFCLLPLALPLGHGYLARAYFGLLMGCVMGRLLSGPYAGPIFDGLRRLPATVVLLGFLLGFYAEHFSRNLMVCFSAAAVVFLSYLLARPTWLSRLHELAPVTWLGRRSYAMYLVHVLCLNAIEARVRIDSGWKAAGVLALGYALTAGTAEVLYRTVEQPTRNFGRRFLARRHEVAAAV